MRTTRCTASTAEVVPLADEVLDRYGAAGARGHAPKAWDSGVPVLAARHHHAANRLAGLTSSTSTAGLTGMAGSTGALAAWLAGFRGGTGHNGLFGGLAGFTAGLASAADLEPRLTTLAATTRARLADHPTDDHRRDQATEWSDYDLIHGPAGALLALASCADPTAAELEPLARHLAGWCDADGLPRLRLDCGRDDPVKGWNHGRVNTGIGHGVAGVIAALTAAVRVIGPTPELTDPLRLATSWLARQSYVDGSAVLTWPAGGLDGAAPPAAPGHRQAWCYGTAGVAWTLWDAGQVLGDDGLCELADHAIATLCAAWDDDFHLTPDELSDRLALCHGAGGVLAVAGAFARHAGHGPAAALRTHLVAFLLERRDQLVALADQDMTLLNGASGALAVLLTELSKQGDRGWLVQIGLR